MSPVSAALAVLFVRRAGYPCSACTLRQWVKRGHIRRLPGGYDLGSIADYLGARSVNRI